MKVLIVDDHPMFRRGVREILEDTAGIDTIIEAENGASAMRQIELLAPDLAIIDLALPEIDGLQLLAWITDQAMGIRCVILTMYDEQQYLERALELGACGYVLKDDAESDLRRCLETVESGETYVSPRCGRRRAPLYPLRDPDLEAKLAGLTDVQRTVLGKVGQFKTSREIAAELGISFRTVQNHRNAIALRLELSGPNQLLRFAADYAVDEDA